MNDFEPMTIDAQFKIWCGALRRNYRREINQVEAEYEVNIRAAAALDARLGQLADYLDGRSHRLADAFDKVEPDWRATAAGRRRFDRFLRQRLARHRELKQRLDARRDRLLRPFRQALQDAADRYDQQHQRNVQRLKRLKRKKTHGPKNPA